MNTRSIEELEALPDDAFIDAAEAARLLGGISTMAVNRYFHRGLVDGHQLPYGHMRLRVGSVRRLRRSPSTRGASNVAALSGAAN